MAKGFKHGSGGAPTTGIPEYTYTGTSQFVAETEGNWHLKLLSSGTLRFSKLKSATNIEACIVGGGTNGTGGEFSASGGRGGEVVNVTVELTKETDYAVTIGAGNGQSSAFGYTASAGGGSSGGSQGQNGANGVHAFNDTKYARFGPGGGGGGYASDYTSGSGTIYPAGKGGDYGGGDGGEVYRNGNPGIANTGGGGGGGGIGSGSDGGAGGSGIVIIRNKRR